MATRSGSHDSASSSAVPPGRRAGAAPLASRVLMRGSGCPAHPGRGAGVRVPDSIGGIAEHVPRDFCRSTPTGCPGMALASANSTASPPAKATAAATGSPRGPGRGRSPRPSARGRFSAPPIEPDRGCVSGWITARNGPGRRAVAVPLSGCRARGRSVRRPSGQDRRARRGGESGGQLRGERRFGLFPGRRRLAGRREAAGHGDAAQHLAADAGGPGGDDAVATLASASGVTVTVM